MSKVSVYSMTGEETDKIELNDDIFAVEINEHLVHMAVKSQLTNNRQGTRKAKTRSEVRGGGKKPWRQKGTGHARQGSIRAAQWKGGGMVFAHVPKEYSLKMNSKEKRIALKSALSSRVLENKIKVLEKIEFPEIKTKNFKEMLDNFEINKAFVILDSKDENTILSARNIKSVKLGYSNTLNVYDILKYENLLITKDAIKQIEEVYA